MWVGILVALLIPVVAGLALWYTDWAESAMVAPVSQPVTNPTGAIVAGD